MLATAKDEEAQELKSVLRHQIVIDAAQIQHIRFIRDLSFMVFLAYYAIFATTGFRLDTSVTNTTALTSILAAIVATVAYVGAVTHFTQSVAGRGVALLLAAFATYGSAIAIENSPNYWDPIPATNDLKLHQFIANGLSLLSMSIAIYFVISFAYYAIISFVLGRIEKQYANIIIIDTLLIILHILNEKSFRDLGTKEQVCRGLRIAANYLENGILRGLSISDPTIRRALQSKLSGSAAYLREMQIRVVLAKDGTKEGLCESLASYVKMLALGFYDALPVSDNEVTPQDKVRAVLRFARTFIVALIPFLCLVIVREVGLTLSVDFTGWAVVVTLAWAAITLVSAIDPLYKSRFQDVRDLMTAIRGKDG